MKRLPSRHVFPGGFEVEIVVGKPGDDYAACYETLTSSTGRITLCRRRTPRQQWRDLAHELVHAVVDAQHHIEESVAP